MEVVTTSHGKSCAFYEEYLNIVKRSNEDGTVIYLRCQIQRSARCRGTIKTKDGNVLSHMSINVELQMTGSAEVSESSEGESTRGTYFHLIKYILTSWVTCII